MRTYIKFRNGVSFSIECNKIFSKSFKIPPGQREKNIVSLGLICKFFWSRFYFHLNNTLKVLLKAPPSMKRITLRKGFLIAIFEILEYYIILYYYL